MVARGAIKTTQRIVLPILQYCIHLRDARRRHVRGRNLFNQQEICATKSQRVEMLFRSLDLFHSRITATIISSIFNRESLHLTRIFTLRGLGMNTVLCVSFFFTLSLSPLIAICLRNVMNYLYVSRSILISRAVSRARAISRDLTFPVYTSRGDENL